jgi:ribosome-binding factor A
MSSGRMRRVDEAIRQVIGDAVSSDLKDPRVGFVTVTDVRTSADLRHARVYVSVLGDAAQRQDTLEGLDSAHGYLQQRIAAELHLKHTPALTFSYDDTAERAMHLEALIDAELAPAGADEEQGHARSADEAGRDCGRADGAEAERE